MASQSVTLVNFRGDLIKEMVNNGHEVIAIGPEPGFESSLASLGASFIQLPMARAGINPLADLMLFFRILKLVHRMKPDVVLSCHVKPVVYGSLAARCAGVSNVYALITGLGYAFVANSLKAKLIRQLTSLLYRLACAACSKVIFQNRDDIEEFVQAGIISESKCELVNGSGVNLERFTPVPLAPKTVFLMICRLIRDKGVFEYMQAARQVRQRYPEVRFQLLGPLDANPSSLRYADIQPYTDDGSLDYLGETDDVRPYIGAARVCVLPSYREGTPRSLLEAMAMGRPIVATDVPGCRETVAHGVNGLLVPVKDSEALAAACSWFVENSGAAKEMGQASLNLCLERFDVGKVNTKMLEIMQLSTGRLTEC